MEASNRDQQASTPRASSGRQLHLTARDAGKAAATAGARRLLLSHFWPGNDRQAARTAAAAVFPGELLLAEEAWR